MHEIIEMILHQTTKYIICNKLKQNKKKIIEFPQLNNGNYLLKLDSNKLNNEEGKWRLLTSVKCEATKDENEKAKDKHEQHSDLATSKVAANERVTPVFLSGVVKERLWRSTHKHGRRNAAVWKQLQRPIAPCP